MAPSKTLQKKQSQPGWPIKTFTRTVNTVGTALIMENVHVTEWPNQHGANRVDRLVSNLLSGGTLSLCGQPERLRWWGYRPVTWPVPSQPGVGHRLSFLSTREASVNWSCVKVTKSCEVSLLPIVTLNIETCDKNSSLQKNYVWNNIAVSCQAELSTSPVLFMYCTHSFMVRKTFIFMQTVASWK